MNDYPRHYTKSVSVSFTLFYVKPFGGFHFWRAEEMNVSTTNPKESGLSVSLPDVHNKPFRRVSRLLSALYSCRMQRRCVSCLQKQKIQYVREMA